MINVSHPPQSETAHPAPIRESFPDGEAYAMACKSVHEARKAFDAPKLTTSQRLDAIGEETIMARIANCEFIHKIAESYEMSAGSLHTWLNNRPEIYARAREQQADKLVADMLEIADNGTNDTQIDADGNKRTDQDVIARSRLRVEARKWLAGKMNAKKYGERVAVGGSDDMPHIRSENTITLSPDEAYLRMIGK